MERQCWHYDHRNACSQTASHRLSERVRGEWARRCVAKAFFEDSSNRGDFLRAVLSKNESSHVSPQSKTRQRERESATDHKSAFGKSSLRRQMER